MAPEPKKGSTKILNYKNFEITKFKKTYFCGMAPPMMYEETGGSIRNRYLENNCNYGRYGFLSLQLFPLYHLEEGSKKSSRNRYSENFNYGTLDFGACS